MTNHIHHRANYDRSTFLERDAGEDPIALFHHWLNEAGTDGLPEHNAMSLATMSEEGPSCRVVLLRSFDDRGFVFFTNYNSHKAIQMERDPRAALMFFWPVQERQIRIEGIVERIDAEASDAYFATRPRTTRIGSWASDQSARISDREALDEKYARWNERFLDDEVPRPAHWGGMRVRPVRIEFWQGRADRMHDRFLFVREAGRDWSRMRLQP